MPAASRLTDLWAGICCCHSPCIAMSGPIVTASPNDISGNLRQARLTDTTIGWCGHPGTIVTAAPGCDANNLGKARIGDQVTGCNIGVIVTGNSTHFVENRSSTCGDREPPEITIDFQGEDITFTEVDYGNTDDESEIDDDLNIYPPVVGREPTAEEIQRSEDLDVTPTTDVEDSTGNTHITVDATAVVCLDIPPTLPDNFPLTGYFTLGDLSINSVLSKNRVRAQHGFTAVEIVCNLQAWAENVGDGLSEQYGRENMIITSGFRFGGSTSQHERGMAADLQWPKKTNTEVYNIAIWLRDNLPFDQLILEYGGNRPWIHVSFNRFGNRPVTASNKYGTRIGPGNYHWGVLKNMS